MRARANRAEKGLLIIVVGGMLLPLCSSLPSFAPRPISPPPLFPFDSFEMKPHTSKTTMALCPLKVDATIMPPPDPSVKAS